MLPSQCLCINLRRAARGVSRYYDGALDGFGINVAQYSLLSNLARLDQPSISSLAEAMGGTLTAQSTPGAGSCFSLALELRLAATRQQDSASAGPLDVDLSAFRVLLAEDHPTNRRVVELILEAVGVDLVCVEDGAQAVEAASHDRFDLILMDMQMPVMDGLTAIRAIRNLPGAVARTPIYALTANALPEHSVASVTAGADGHITKPINAATLVAAVQAVAQAQAPAPGREPAQSAA